MPSDPPKKYTDVDGNEIQLKQYTDESGKPLSPIQINPFRSGVPLGEELYTPQTKSDYENVVAPTLMRLTAGSIPAAGSLAFGPLGTVAGSAIERGMQHLAPQLFGQPEGDPIQETIKSVILNDAFPGMAEAFRPSSLLNNPITRPVLTRLPSVRNAVVTRLTDALMGANPRTESEILTDAATVGGPTPLTSTQKLMSGQRIGGTQVSGFGNTEPLRYKQALTDILAGTQNFSELADDVFKDAQNVRNFRMAVDNPQIVEEMAISRLIRHGYDAGEKRLDAAKIIREVSKNRDIYSSAMTAEGMRNFGTALDEINNLQYSPGTDRVLNWAKGKLMLTVPGVLFGGPVGHALGTAGGLAITDRIMGRALANPETANLFIEAMRTPAASDKGRFIADALYKFLAVPQRSKLAIGTRITGNVLDAAMSSGSAEEGK